ncbi:uncharacterized protein TNCV_2178081 [Trichonephila clavipes]|uniref:HAT C-terminal dimerisation domain-containing protein n=1 Tax=Trichonephila clavipes TaxID=2585209 RepID=A0A8X7B952_TRICX|nr:uncharacterized protein TNCV_2178081 [Trichonephila clavipes]
MINKGDKAVCVLCSETVVCRTSSVKRYFETNHKSFCEKSEPEQKELIANAIKDRNKLSTSMFKYVSKNCHTSAASFSAANARHGKPFQEGEFLKEAWLACATSLFDDFDNKDKIIQRIKDVPLSRNTMKDRILKLAENVTDQHKNYINSAPFISLCLDESIDITKSARLAVFARYCVGNIIKEELIAITSLLTTAKGTDICTTARNSLAKKGIDLKKSVSVTTDGAPNMKRYYYKKLQVLPKLKKKYQRLRCAQVKRNEEKVIDDFISIMDSLIKEFSARYSLFKELSETFKFIMYPDVISFDKLNLSQFDWLEIEELEMQLIDFQSSSTWIQKFIETRKKLEWIEAERLKSNISKNTSNEILKTWNLIPDAFNCLKKLAYAILTIFSSTYACESLFSEINSIKDSLRNRLTDDSNSACILNTKSSIL